MMIHYIYVEVTSTSWIITKNYPMGYVDFLVRGKELYNKK